MKEIQFLLFIFILLPVLSFSQSMSIGITGSSAFNDIQYDIKEAGTDFTTSIENESDLYIHIEYINFWDKFFSSNNKWKIHIQKADIDWNPNIVIETKRTGDGNRPWYRSGSVKINDGLTYQTITNTPMYFFSGKDEIFYIPIQIKISGISLTMGAKDFETNIMLTVYDD
jgi:hypothetical protein